MFSRFGIQVIGDFKWGSRKHSNGFSCNLCVEFGGVQLPCLIPKLDVVNISCIICSGSILKMWKAMVPKWNALQTSLVTAKAIAYVEGVLRVTRKYAESRMVWVDKDWQFDETHVFQLFSDGTTNCFCDLFIWIWHLPCCEVLVFLRPSEERKMPLAELPYMKKVLHSVEAGHPGSHSFWDPVANDLADRIHRSQKFSQGVNMIIPPKWKIYMEVS